MNHLRICVCLLAVLLMAGCAATGRQAPTTGHLTGRLVMEGGPLGPGGQQPGERPVPGSVTFTAGHQRVTVQVGSSGSFSVRLAPGRYQVCGRSPSIEVSNGPDSEKEAPCAEPLSATVTAGRTAAITVALIVP
jgi:hypothetical protein